MTLKMKLLLPLFAMTLAVLGVNQWLIFPNISNFLEQRFLDSHSKSVDLFYDISEHYLIYDPDLPSLDALANDLMESNTDWMQIQITFNDQVIRFPHKSPHVVDSD